MCAGSILWNAAASRIASPEAFIIVIGFISSTRCPDIVASPQSA